MTTGNRGFFALPSLGLLVLLLSAAGWPAEPPKAKPAPPVTGQLNIEGQGIERIILERRDARDILGPNDRVVLDRPGSSVPVPAGEYWVQRVELKGGYSRELPRRLVDRLSRIEQEVQWLTISPEKPCLLKIGGPLKWKVAAVRQGRTVRFACGLFDRSGRMYSPQRARRPPQFTVYCHNRVVGSGSFEYG